MLMSDLRHGFRVLLRTPIFTLSAVLVLTLGIGATTAIFSLLNAVLIKPLPYANADRLVMMWENNVPRNRPRNVISAANFLAWQERSTSFDDMAILTTTRVNMTGSGAPEELSAVQGSANLLSLVGAQPLRGRVFAPGEDEAGATRTVLLSEGFWERRFGRRDDIVGQVITIGDQPTTVVGLLPSGFELFGQKPDVWLPLVFTDAHRRFTGRSFVGVGRMKEGITRDQAQQELEAVAAQLSREQPEFNSGWTVNLVPLREQLTGDLKPALLVLFGAVVAVLLIACVNLVNLLLARAMFRRHEMAVRAALGAGTRRLVRQMLTETALLVAAGGTGGVLLAAWLQRVIVETAERQAAVPLLAGVKMDLPVLLFAVLTTALVTMACGLGPALAIRRRSVVEPLRDGARGATDGRHGRMRGVLVAAEVAMAVVLLAGAGLLVRSFAELQQVDPGFNPSNVLTMRVINRGVSTPGDLPRAVAFNERALERLRELPGVVSAAGTAFLPLAGMGSATSFWLEDRPQPEAADRPVADIRPVSSGYFRTLGIATLAGRDFGPQDAPDRPLVAIVNESFVRRFYPGENPLGQRLTYSWDVPTTVEIVGVVGDVTLTSLDGDVRSTVYLPHAQRALGMMTFVVRTEGEPAALANAATAALQALDPDQPVALVRTLDDVVSRSLSRPRVTSTAIAAFAAVALLLAIVGVYGVVAYGVSQRMREFGVRLALGARPRDVLALVLRQGMTMVGIGLIAGVAAAIPASRLLRSLLFGVGPGDPATLAGVATLMAAVALVACYIPARRSTLADPAITLRAE